MPLTLKELTDKLGVGYLLNAYETCPWSLSDSGQSLTCSAEVRMGNDADELEAELQLVHDQPMDDQKAVEQVFFFYTKLQPHGKWSGKIMRIKGQDYVDKIPMWEEKGCNFFNACVQELKMGQMPNIEDLIDREINENGGETKNMRGGGTSKAPKVRPQKLLGMKQGRGF